MGSSISPAGAAKSAAGFGAGEPAVIVLQLTVDDDIVNALRELRGIRIGGLVNNCIGVKNSNVRVEADLEETTVRQVLALSGHGSNFANGLLKRHQVLVANVTPQESRHGSKGARM